MKVLLSRGKAKLTVLVNNAPPPLGPPFSAISVQHIPSPITVCTGTCTSLIATGPCAHRTSPTANLRTLGDWTWVDASCDLRECYADLRMLGNRAREREEVYEWWRRMDASNRVQSAPASITRWAHVGGVWPMGGNMSLSIHLATVIRRTSTGDAINK